MYTKVLVFTFVSLLTDSVFAPPPGLYDGQTWNPAPGCPQGGVYMINNKSIRCHCWGFQGYICEPNFPSGRSGFGGTGGGGGNGCPPGTSVCVVNNNANSNSNSNTNTNRNNNRNRNGNRNGNGNNADYGSDYANYDG